MNNIKSKIPAEKPQKEKWLTRDIILNKLLSTINGIGDFTASILIGFLWTAISPVAGFAAAGLLMLIGAITVLFNK